VDFTPESDGKISIDVLHPENDVYMYREYFEDKDVRAIGTTIELEQPEDTIINGTTEVRVVVKDELGNPVVNQTVELTFTDDEENTVTIPVTTDENGEAVYVYDDTLVGKDVEVTAGLAENDDGYEISETDEPESFTVEKLDPIIDIDYEDGITAHRPTDVTVTVSTEEGSIPVGEAVNVVITQGDEELYNGEAILDENGQVVIPFTPETTDDIEVTVLFDETDQYNEGYADDTITPIKAMGIIMNVTAENTTINGTSNITVTLTDEDGNPLNGTVEITIPGEDEPRPVEVINGTGSIIYDDTEEGKDLNITATLVEPTDGYEPVEPVEVPLSVAKLDPVITIEPETPVTAHEPNSATITVTTSEGSIPVGEEVTVTVTQNGDIIATITGNLDEEGKLPIEYMPQSTDDVTISVVFDETPVYNSADAETTVGNIKSTKTYLNITSEDVSINGTSHITLNVTDEEGNPVNGTATLTIDGNLVEVPVTDGAAVYEYNNTQVGKNVTVTGYFDADSEKGYLKSNVNSTTFEVSKLPIDIACDFSEDLTAHKPATATVTLTNDTDKQVVVPGEEVTVVIKDEEGNVLANVTATTNDEGQVVVDFTPVTDGKISIDVLHPENDVYLRVNGVADNSVSAIGTTIEHEQP
jgi:hypothetical protein